MATNGVIDLANQYAVGSPSSRWAMAARWSSTAALPTTPLTWVVCQGKGSCRCKITLEARDPVNLVLTNGTLSEYGGVLQGPGSLNMAGGTGGVGDPLQPEPLQRRHVSPQRHPATGRPARSAGDQHGVYVGRQHSVRPIRASPTASPPSPLAVCPMCLHHHRVGPSRCRTMPPRR